MVTGDHAGTALNIARALDIASPDDVAVLGSELRDPAALSPEARRRLLDATVVARATPEHKLWLLALYQGAGATVAMIGDGVNDAPALKRADIGVAMGKRGTAVAREAAAMVLQDDNFGTIVVAVEQGRVIFDNIRKFVVYLLGCNLSELLVVGLASASGAPLPILPLQILFLNLVTDVLPALALGIGRGDPRVMERRPRPRDEPFLRRADWTRIAVDGLTLSAAVLVAFALSYHALGLDDAGAVTVAFLVLALSQVWHVWNLAERDSHWAKNEVTQNLWVWGAVALCLLLVTAGMTLPLLARVLSLQPIGASGLGLSVAMSLVPLVAGRALHLSRWASGTSAGSSDGNAAVADRGVAHTYGPTHHEDADASARPDDA
jgi:Ca2+-transporting ATPase